MNLPLSVFGGKKGVEERGPGSEVVDGQMTTVDGTRSADLASLGLPRVSAEMPLNEGGFKSGPPVNYGENHVGVKRACPAESVDGLGAEEQPLNLPPLSVAPETSIIDPNQPPNGSIDGPLDDLYITNGRGAIGTERPNVFQQRLREEGLGVVYRGDSSELRLPLSSARETIHRSGPDTGVTHSA